MRGIKCCLFCLIKPFWCEFNYHNIITVKKSVTAVSCPWNLRTMNLKFRNDLCKHFKVIFTMIGIILGNFQFVHSASITVDSYVRLTTNFGDLLGAKEVIETRGPAGERKEFAYVAFRGLPYTEEPAIGSLRWQYFSPKRSIPSGITYDATKEGPDCPQWIHKGNRSELIGHESCLHATVYLPLWRLETLRNSTQAPLMSIMVFFHGGGFLQNSNRNAIPVPLLAHGNVIVVTFNYRVGIFGYLSTGTEDLPGNYGALDQITMLRWIQLYGQGFGGNVNDVTVFGSSIGSVSIHYLLLSGMASGLFHAAIMESGSAFCERSLVPNPLDIARTLGSYVGCSNGGTADLVLCLKSKSTLELMLGAKRLTKQWVLPTVLGPVIDRYSRPPGYQFLPDFPENLDMRNRVPVILGVTRDEGLTAFVQLSKEFRKEELGDLQFIRDVILPHYLNLIMRWRPEQMKNGDDRHLFIKRLAGGVIDFYGFDFANDPLSTLVGILGDLWINFGSRKALESLCSQNAPVVYAYLFTHHDPGVSPSEIAEPINEYHRKGIHHPVLDFGAAHTEEALYLITDQKDLERVSQFPRNHLMAETLGALWSSFAITKNPNKAMKLHPHLFTGWPSWTPVCSSYPKYEHYAYPLLEISLRGHNHVENYRIQESEFWWRVHQDTLRRQTAPN